MKKEKHLGLRIDEELLEKFHYVCDYEGRSANGQLLYMVRQLVNDFEAKQGKIELPEDQK